MPTAEQNSFRLQRLIGIAALALVGSTWRLWTPETELPQIPWFLWACRTPAGVDRLALALLIASCLALVFASAKPALRRGGLWLFAVSLAVLLLPSQQRLQPWAWELLVVAVTLTLAPPDHAMRLIRWFVASIYIHSALSKFDVTFFDTQGEMLLGGLLDALALSDEFWSERMRQCVIGLFPAGELIIGIGLLIPSLHHRVVVASYVMHVLLLLTLGPLGLNHRPGVLIWNVFFIAQNWLLYRPAQRAEEDTASEAGSGTDESRIRRHVATVIVAGAILGPLLQNWGRFDVWPGWGVYSARPSQVTMTVNEERAGDLPSGLQEFIGPPEALSNWRPVNLDAWSFASLNCPIYPEERFRIAVILAVAEESALDDGVRVMVSGAPNRLTGERETTELIGTDDLQRYSERFRLNTMARE